jgi:hypothetical protein
MSAVTDAMQSLPDDIEGLRALVMTLITGAAPVASEALQRIAALYEVDARVRGKSPAERLAIRQAASRPLVTELRA